MSTCVNLLTDQLGTCDGSLNIGKNSYAYNDRSTAIGVNARAESNSTVIGYNSLSASNSVIIGSNISNCFSNNITIGARSRNYGSSSTVIGTNAFNNGSRNVVIASGIDICSCASITLCISDTILLAAGMCSANNPAVKFVMSAGSGCYLEFKFGSTTKRISATDFFTKLGI